MCGHVWTYVDITSGSKVSYWAAVRPVPAMRRASAAKKLSHHKGTEPDTSDGTGPLTGKVISDPV